MATVVGKLVTGVKLVIVDGYGQRAAHLVGVKELAELLGVTRTAVSNRASRDSHFPDPVATLAATPVWDAHQVVQYWNRSK